MINVAIVDDDEKTLEQTRACIEHLENLPEEVDVKTFSLSLIHIFIPS